MKHRFEKFANKYSKTTNLLLSIFVYTIVTFGLLPLNDAIATVYVSTITAKYIVIAIDSREVFTIKANENVCKLAILPKDMIYFGDGIVNADLSDIKFNIKSVVYDVFTADTSNDIEKIRNFFTQKIATIYERLFHLHETEAVSATAQGMVQHGFFAGLNSAGIPIVAADEITYHRSGIPSF